MYANWLHPFAVHGRSRKKRGKIAMKIFASLCWITQSLNSRIKTAAKSLNIPWQSGSWMRNDCTVFFCGGKRFQWTMMNAFYARCTKHKTNAPAGDGNAETRNTERYEWGVHLRRRIFSPVFCVSFDFIWLMKCCISLDLVKSNHFFYSGRTRWERNKYYTCTTQIDGVGVAQKPFPVFFCLRRGLRCAVHIHLFYSTENYCASAITNVIKYVNLSTLK